MGYRLLLLLPLLAIESAICAQSPPRQNGDTLGIANSRLVSKYVNGVDSKAGYIDKKLDKQTIKVLRKWKEQEGRIKRKLERADSLKAAAIFGNADEQYNKLQRRLEKSTSLQQYSSSFDTLSTSLKFLKKNEKFLAITKDGQKKLRDAMTKVKGMEGQFQKAEEVKKFLRERKQLLKEQLQNIGFAKELKKLNKQAYYYNAQLSEYRSLLKDHKKAEQKALELLGKSKMFTDFMRKNSMLSSLFRMSGDPLPPQASLSGLQTRVQVSGLIQQQIAAGGANAQQRFSQNMQAAQSQMNELKNKINQFGSGSSDVEMPEGFKPNSEKVKSFFKRLEVGTNVQSQKANGFFPVSSDLGLSIGYKLNERFTAGIGGSYRVGWGKNIRHINITHQGAGVRSFGEYKIKGSWWLMAGYEMNYRSEFRNIDELKEYSAWAKSGLIGLSKVVSLKTKFFKKTKLQLLWDVLSYQQVPRTQAVVLRVGYSLK